MGLELLARPIGELYEVAGVCYSLSTDGRATVIEKPSRGAKAIRFKADDEVFCEAASFVVIRYIVTAATFRVNYPGWQPIGNPGPANGGPGPDDPARLGRQTSIDPQLPLNTAKAVALAQAKESDNENWWSGELFAEVSKPTFLLSLDRRLSQSMRFMAYLPKSQWTQWAYTPNPTSTVVVVRYYSPIDTMRLEDQARNLDHFETYYDDSAGAKY